MPERNLNFDQVIDRHGTLSLKYDFARERGKLKDGEPDDLLPLWVADMDFKSSSYIQDALKEMAEFGVFGYSEVKEDYFEVLQSFYARRHHFDIPNSSWMIKSPGVMVVLALAIKAFTKPGESVLIQNPVYMHFEDAIRVNGRKTVSNDLVRGEDGRYHIDFEDFERKIVDNGIKLFLLCSPHNPVCRVWTREELERVAEICLRHHVLVVSDEIHGDFIFSGEHIPFASLSKEVSDITVTITAPTKTFNLAGLQIAHAFIGNPKLRRAISHEMDATAYSQVSLPGLVAARAAYTHGEVWLDSMLEYLKGNIQFVDEFVRKNLPAVKLIPMEATYLAWLDFNGTGKSDSEIEDRILHRARLWLNSGSRFGECGRGFQRMNLASPRSILQEALVRIVKAFED